LLYSAIPGNAYLKHPAGRKPAPTEKKGWLPELKETGICSLAGSYG
jgi:hypothetical protein